jgi:hypothetical protein
VAVADVSRVFGFLKSIHGARDYINRGMRDLCRLLEGVVETIDNEVDASSPERLLENDFVATTIPHGNKKLFTAVTSNIAAFMSSLQEDVGVLTSADPNTRRRLMSCVLEYVSRLDEHRAHQLRELMGVDEDEMETHVGQTISFPRRNIRREHPGESEPEGYLPFRSFWRSCCMQRYSDPNSTKSDAHLPRAQQARLSKGQRVLATVDGKIERSSTPPAPLASPRFLAW